jgi:hypothetical protein
MRHRWAMALAAVLLGALVAPTPAGAAETEPWIRVDRVMVNRLGGVTVQGTHSCASFYDQLLSTEGLTVWDEMPDGSYQPRQLLADEGDTVVIGTNPDNFVVTQPSGRKTMIRVEHGSSRLQWCFATDPDVFDDLGWSIPCEAYGPCQWVTDRFSWSSTEPLFVYSPNGKFKTGSMNVAVTQMGYWIEIHRADGSLDGGQVFNEAFNNQIVRAVAYR